MFCFVLVFCRFAASFFFYTHTKQAPFCTYGSKVKFIDSNQSALASSHHKQIEAITVVACRRPVTYSLTISKDMRYNKPFCTCINVREQNTTCKFICLVNQRFIINIITSNTMVCATVKCEFVTQLDSTGNWKKAYTPSNLEIRHKVIAYLKRVTIKSVCTVYRNRDKTHRQSEIRNLLRVISRLKWMPQFLL